MANAEVFRVLLVRTARTTVPQTAEHLLVEGSSLGDSRALFRDEVGLYRLELVLALGFCLPDGGALSFLE